jgi:BNR repeat-like domain
MPRVLLLAFAAILTPHAAAAEHAHSDAAAAQGVLSVDVYAAGDTVDVLTAERAGASAAPTLWYRRSIDGGKSWGEPVRVGEGMPVPHQPHRANDPQIASSGRQVIAVWASAGRGYRSSGAMVTALSTDGGRTWKRGPNPADDDRYDGHGFADLAARGGRFHLTWLDKRSGAQGVRYAYSNDAGASWSRNVSVRATSCECCWNTLLPASDRSVYLLFRGKAPRDMGIASSRDEGVSWKTVGAVGAFNWQIEACPETGGALAATRRGASERLHALVWTGQTGQRGVHYMSSLDGGSDWTHGTRFGSEFAQRADLTARGEELVAVWDDIAGQNGAVFMSRSKNSGAEWSKPMKLSAERASAIYPRVVATNASFLVLWTETSSNESQLRMLLLK